MSSACHVLFLCTGNSARSILAESILNRFGAGHFVGWSAGSSPKGIVHPEAIKLLESLNFRTDMLRSKSWDEFAGGDAPRIDLIITVCDNAAGETCPIWPGRPIRAHWGIPDPAAADEDDQRIAFAEAYDQLFRRIKPLIDLPVEALDAENIARHLHDIGLTADMPAKA